MGKDIEAGAAALQERRANPAVRSRSEAALVRAHELRRELEAKDLQQKQLERSALKDYDPEGSGDEPSDGEASPCASKLAAASTMKRRFPADAPSPREPTLQTNTVHATPCDERA